MRDDEKKFLVDVYEASHATKWVVISGVTTIIRVPILSPRDVIEKPNFYMHRKRAWYLLKKWSKKDWYGYGVSRDLGWLTPKGVAKAKELIRGVEIE